MHSPKAPYEHAAARLLKRFEIIKSKFSLKFINQQAGYPGFARGRTLPLFRVNKLINILNINKAKASGKKCGCFVHQGSMHVYFEINL